MTRLTKNDSTQSNEFSKELSKLNIDATSSLKTEETENQTKLSKREIKREQLPKITYIKSIASQEKFNERFRDEWKYAWEYVSCIVENKEVPGEQVEFWMKDYPGEDATFWRVPVNKPILLPRFVAQHLSARAYAQLSMDPGETREIGDGVQQYGFPVYKSMKKRIDCIPVSSYTNPFNKLVGNF
jgi:hypothetical protein